MRKTSALLLALAFVAGCEHVTAPSIAVAVAVDPPGVPAPGTVSFSVHNQTDESVFISMCGDRILTELEINELGEWKNAAAGICLLNQPEVPMELRPGGTVAGDVLLPKAGEYRVVVSYRSGSVSTLRETRSAAFSIF